MGTHLHFSTKIGTQKPVTIVNKGNSCPFCDVDGLENIIAREDSIILLKNKYSTLKNTFQTVLIETDECDSELSTYKKDHLYKVIHFAIKNWLQLEMRKDFKSVILFKNHGPLSGGTIRHPHMQIVGLEEVDYKENIQFESFEGATIYKDKNVEFNISLKPKMGFYELNVILHDMTSINTMADCIQTATDYILNHFHYKCESYNLFFYHINGVISCKIIPRFVTTPLYIGYSIPQVSDDIEIVAGKLKKFHLQKHDIN
jgi:galactose-1-phosphate uridylyltransferase